MANAALGAQLIMDHSDVLLYTLCESSPNVIWPIALLQRLILSSVGATTMTMGDWTPRARIKIKRRFVVPIFFATLVTKPWCWLFSTHGDPIH